MESNREEKETSAEINLYDFQLCFSVSSSILCKSFGINQFLTTSHFISTVQMRKLREREIKNFIKTLLINWRAKIQTEEIWLCSPDSESKTSFNQYKLHGAKCFFKEKNVDLMTSWEELHKQKAYGIYNYQLWEALIISLRMIPKLVTKKNVQRSSSKSCQENAKNLEIKEGFCRKV